MQEPSPRKGQATALGRVLRKCEDLLGRPVEIGLAMDKAGLMTIENLRPEHISPKPDEMNARRCFWMAPRSDVRGSATNRPNLDGRFVADGGEVPDRTPKSLSHPLRQWNGLRPAWRSEH